MSKDDKPQSQPSPEAPSQLSNLAAKIPRVPWNSWLALVFVILVYYFSQIIASLLISIYPALHHWTNTQANDWLNNSVLAQFFFVLVAEAITLGAIYMFLRIYRTNFRIIGLKVLIGVTCGSAWRLCQCTMFCIC